MWRPISQRWATAREKLQACANPFIPQTHAQVTNSRNLLCQMCQLIVTLRLSWHGWPVHSVFADAMQAPLLDASLLSRAHELTGSGFAIPCTTTVLLATLACIGLRSDDRVPPQLPALVPEGFQVGGCAGNCSSYILKSKREVAALCHSGPANASEWKMFRGLLVARDPSNGARTPRVGPGNARTNLHAFAF